MAAFNGEKLATIHPSPELPDDMSIADLELRPKATGTQETCGKHRIRTSCESQTSGRVRSPFSAKPWGCHLPKGSAAMLHQHGQGTTMETAEAVLTIEPQPSRA